VEKFKLPSTHDGEDILTYLSKSVPASVAHTGDADFQSHLSGVGDLLRGWGAPTYLQNAGTLHSLYGTEGFQGFKIDVGERGKVREVAGERGEKLVCWFCVVDRWSVDRRVRGEGNKVRSRRELGGFELEMGEEEFLDFVELTLADWMEQVEGAATKSNTLFLWDVGEAWAYRRSGYGDMVRLLERERGGRAEGIRRCYDEVMGREVRGGGKNGRTIREVKDWLTNTQTHKLTPTPPPHTQSCVFDSRRRHAILYRT